jgi:hypothetical protein
MLGRFKPSSEAYREFIRGIFQLYILGPTLQRIESALNVTANLPVIRDDGEVFDAYVFTDPTYNYVYTLRPNSTRAEYAFPKDVPIRADVIAGDKNKTFEAFEALTTAFTVTDYVETPTWWDEIIIPQKLMPKESESRRTVIPILLENTIGQSDDPRVGDPGLFVGADDEGNIPAEGEAYPAARRKMANVVMERFLKQHLFFVKFDSSISTLLTADVVTDLHELVFVVKPSYTQVYIEPTA